MAWLQPLESAVQDIVVVDRDRSTCKLIVDALGDSGVAVQCAMTGRSGRRLLTGKHFDLAIIDIILPDASGLALAAIAANENTPVLLIIGHSNAIARLKQYDLLDFPCLLKPLDPVRICSEAERVVAETRRNIQRIRDSMARWQANFAGLEDVMADSKRLIDVSGRLCDEATVPSPNEEYR
jgi:DNA-binding NtrC family response regulator